MSTRAKTATRRQLSGVLGQAVPVINLNTQNIQTLHAEVVAQHARLEALETARVTWQAQSLVNRLLWLVRGVQA